jgi:hypothetical protein
MSELWEIAYSTKTKLDRKLKALRIVRIQGGHLVHAPPGHTCQETEVIVAGKRETSPVIIRVSTSPTRFVTGERDYVEIEIPRGLAEVAKITCGTVYPEKTRKKQ